MTQAEKILEGMKQKGRPVEIPDVSRNDIPELLKHLGMKTIVEIGVYRGEYTEVLAKAGLTVYGVDPWDAYVEYPYYDQPNTQDREDANYQMTLSRVGLCPNVTLIRKTSMDALADFPDESVDCVYIDGNHSFKYVAEDVASWIKKVKPGGFLCGHDYFYGNPKNMHVRYVIDAYVESHGLKNLYVLGLKKAPKGQIRDKWRSWILRKA